MQQESKNHLEEAGEVSPATGAGTGRQRPPDEPADPEAMSEGSESK